MEPSAFSGQGAGAHATQNIEEGLVGTLSDPVALPVPASPPAPVGELLASLQDDDGVRRRFSVQLEPSETLPSAHTAEPRNLVDVGHMAVIVEAQSAPPAVPVKSEPADVGDAHVRWPVWRQIAVALGVTASYGVGIFANMSAGRFLDSYHPVAWATQLLIMAISRILAAVVVAAWLTGRELCRPGPRPPSRPTNIRLVALTALISAFLASTLYVPLYFLGLSGEISVLSPIVTLHASVPAIVGLCRDEKLTLNKGISIALSLVAVLILGFAARSDEAEAGAADGGAGGAVWALRIVLLLLCVMGWGSTDTFASRVGRRLSQRDVAIAMALGLSITATLAAAVILVNEAAAADGFSTRHGFGFMPTTADGDAQANSISALGAIGVISVTNFLSIIGWIFYTILGRHGERSVFAPVVQLYMVVPAVLSMAIFGEAITVLKVVGLSVAVGAVLLMGTPLSLPTALTSGACCLGVGGTSQTLPTGDPDGGAPVPVPLTPGAAFPTGPTRDTNIMLGAAGGEPASASPTSSATDPTAPVLLAEPARGVPGDPVQSVTPPPLIP